MGGLGSGKTKAASGKSESLYPPAWLPTEAKQVFHVLARQLDAHALTKADTLALALMAEWVWVNKLAVVQIAARGVLEEDSAHSKDPENPEMRKNPAISVSRAATTVLMDIAKQFGMTPSARARLGIEQTGGGMTLAEILRPKDALGARAMAWMVADGDPEDDGTA